MSEMSEPQRRALMEKLEKMSPEELREFQKKQCIFCQISSNKVKSKKVYEDEKVFAVLDINPASKGHLLVLPKEHYAILPQVPDEEIKHLGIVAKHLSQAVLRGLKAQGTTIFIANGTAAGQRAQHFMVHIIPREEHDNIGIVLPQKKTKESDISSVRESIQAKLNEQLGIKKEVVKERKEHSEETDPELGEQRKSEEKQEQPSKKGKKSKSKEKMKTSEGSVSLDDIAGLFNG